MICLITLNTYYVIAIVILLIIIAYLYFDKSVTESAYQEVIQDLKLQNQEAYNTVAARNTKIDELMSRLDATRERLRTYENDLETLEDGLNTLEYYRKLETEDNDHFDKVKEFFRKKFHARTIVVDKKNPITLKSKKDAQGN